MIDGKDVNEIKQIYNETTNPIGKVFCIWSLKDQDLYEYNKLLKQLRDEKKHTIIKVLWYGCIIDNITIEELLTINFENKFNGN